MPVDVVAMAAVELASILAPGLGSFAVNKLADKTGRKIKRKVKKKAFIAELKGQLEDSLHGFFGPGKLSEDALNRLDELKLWLDDEDIIDRLFAISTPLKELAREEDGAKPEPTMQDDDKGASGYKQARLLDKLTDDVCGALGMSDPDQRQQELLRGWLTELSSQAFDLFWSLLEDGEKLQAKIQAKMLDEQTAELEGFIAYHGGFAEHVAVSHETFWQNVAMQKGQDSRYRSRSHLYYRLEHAGFHARETELKRLEKFCCGSGRPGDDRKFRWWALTGPGGTGKSRLAFEFAKRLRGKGWQAFFASEAFLEEKSFPDWSTEHDLLVVVDYAQKYPELVSGWIKHLTSKHATLNRRLRLLMVERDSGDNAPWFTQGGFGSVELPDWRYPLDEDFLELGALKPRELEDFACIYLRAAGRQDAADLAPAAVEAFTELDEKQRLLYLVMVLDTLMEHGIKNVRKWKPDILAEHIVKRELEAVENRYNTLGLDGRQKDACKRTLAFCTATKGWPYNALPDYIKQNLACLGSLAAADKPIALGAERAAGGIYTLPPFEPDIVGEHLACRILSECFTTTAQRQELIDAAWMAAPTGFKFFLYRLEQDGLHVDGTDYSTVVDQLFQMPGQKCGRPALLEYCELLWGSIPLLPLDRCQENIQQLQAIYDGSGGDAQIALQLAMGLYNLTCVQQGEEGVAGSVERIQGVYGRFKDDAQIALWLARGLYNLTVRQRGEEGAA